MKKKARMTLVVAYLGLLVSVFVISADAGVSMHNEFYCYSSDLIRPQTRMHGTRSSYEAIRRASFDPHVSCKFTERKDVTV